MWDSDPPSFMQPKVSLLPPPSHSYHQPPPLYRPNRPTSSAPLFPVPPPGSCLLPPPPLPPTPHQPSTSWSQSSWQEGLEISLPDTPFYSYQRERQTPRTRTLVEVPLVETTSKARTTSSLQSVNVLQSNLDPTSQPFQPSSSIQTSQAIQEDTTLKDLNIRTSPLPVDAASPLEHLAVSWEPSSSPQADQDDDFLPFSPSCLLPLDLDISTEDQQSKVARCTAGTQAMGQVVSKHIFHPPPILPLTNHWSGTARPPLLPTPSNFPPYGPRSKVCQTPNAGALFSTTQASSPLKLPGVVEWLLSQTENEGEEENLTEDQNGSDSLSTFPAWTPYLPSLEPESLLAPHPVPAEYLTGRVLRSKLPPLKLARSHTDLLLFLFYCLPGDLAQVVAASILFERGWRYHCLDQVWLARWPGVTPEEKTEDWEEGLYQYFDVKTWKRIPGRFRLNYTELAEKSVVTEEEKSLSLI